MTNKEALLGIYLFSFCFDDDNDNDDEKKQGAFRVFGFDRRVYK